MDRFLLETPAELVGNRLRARYETFSTPDLPECQNCGKPSADLKWQPDFAYMGCPSCVAEAERMLLIEALEAAEPVICTVCLCDRMTVASDRRVLGTPGSVCCGEVA